MIDLTKELKPCLLDFGPILGTPKPETYLESHPGFLVFIDDFHQLGAVGGRHGFRVSGFRFQQVSEKLLTLKPEH